MAASWQRGACGPGPGGGSAGRPGGGSISGKGMRKKEVQNCHLIAAVVRSV